jgi:ornithine cyclodeaminase/alanine dehydrogenase-like protein (mu-crystallin family)
MDDVIDVVERGFREYGAGRAVNRPRQRVAVDGGTLNVMAAGLPAWGVFGLKSYAVTRDGRRFVSLLYSAESGQLLAMMEAEGLGRLRTGAASGVATRYLAREDAGTVGILGTGAQARTQLQAIARVRPVALVKAYSRTTARREAFADDMVQELGAEVVAVDSPEEAVAEVDIIVTITPTRDPVLRGAWLRPGVHINAAGSNAAGRRELDEEAVGRAARVVVDARDQAMVEAGDLLAPIRAGRLSWEQVEELGPIVAGTAPGRRSNEEITLFESQGIALEDVATMSLIYTRARDARRGEEIAR